MIKNKSVITAFSLSPDSEKILDKLQKRQNKTRSEIVRNLIKSYSKSSPKVSLDPKNSGFFPAFNADETNKILRYYYQIISGQDRKPTIVIGIAIISKSSKVLIGQRKPPDQYVKNLTWTFPTGKFSSLDFEKELVKTVKKESGLNIKIRDLIHARLIPDSPAKKVRIVALYYHCKASPGKPRAGGDFRSVKWVPAVDVTKYFTTSVADEIMNFLGTL